MPDNGSLKKWILVKFDNSSLRRAIQFEDLLHYKNINSMDLADIRSVEQQDDGMVRVILQVTAQREAGWHFGDPLLWPAGVAGVTYILLPRYMNLTLASYL